VLAKHENSSTNELAIGLTKRKLGSKGEETTSLSTITNPLIIKRRQ
jgi:hypothetical protein